MSSADDILKLDLRQYEHAINGSELELLRQAMLNGETGETTIPVWLTIEREVSIKCVILLYLHGCFYDLHVYVQVKYTLFGWFVDLLVCSSCICLLHRDAMLKGFLGVQNLFLSFNLSFCNIELRSRVMPTFTHLDGCFIVFV